MPQSQRTVLLGLAALVLAVAIVVAVTTGGGGDSTTTATTPVADTPPATSSTPTAPAGSTAPAKTSPQVEPAVPGAPVVTVRDGKPVGGVQTLKFHKGDTIDFLVRSDVADEIHFHGYDIGMKVPAGGHVEIRTRASIDGIFVVELEQRGTQIASVVVEP